MLWIVTRCIVSESIKNLIFRLDKADSSLDSFEGGSK